MVECRCLLHSFAGVHVQLSGNLGFGRGSPQRGPQEVQIPDPVLHRFGGGIYSIVLCVVRNWASQEGEGMSNSQFCQVAEKRVYTVEEITTMLRISRTAAYELVKKAEFAVIRSGGWIRVPRASFDAWLDGRGTR